MKSGFVMVPRAVSEVAGWRSALLYLVIAHYVSWEDGFQKDGEIWNRDECIKSLAELAEKTGYSVNIVRKLLENMVECGLITTEKISKKGLKIRLLNQNIDNTKTTRKPHENHTKTTRKSHANHTKENGVSGLDISKLQLVEDDIPHEHHTNNTRKAHENHTNTTRKPHEPIYKELKNKELIINNQEKREDFSLYEPDECANPLLKTISPEELINAKLVAKAWEDICASKGMIKSYEYFDRDTFAFVRAARELSVSQWQEVFTHLAEDPFWLGEDGNYIGNPGTWLKPGWGRAKYQQIQALKNRLKKAPVKAKKLRELFSELGSNQPKFEEMGG